jgi:hypothetical protein
MNDVRKAANGRTVDCVVFQDQLASLIESGEDLSTNPHLQTCENCSSLVSDLEYIARAAKLLLPIHDPGPKVWENIQIAIKDEEPKGVK